MIKGIKVKVDVDGQFGPFDAFISEGDGRSRVLFPLESIQAIAAADKNIVAGVESRTHRGYWSFLNTAEGTDGPWYAPQEYVETDDGEVTPAWEVLPDIQWSRTELDPHVLDNLPRPTYEEAVNEGGATLDRYLDNLPDTQPRGWEPGGRFNEGAGIKEMPLIHVTRTTVDGIREEAEFDNLPDAKAYARRWLGDLFDIGSTYAICGHGIQKIEVEGAATLEQVCGRGEQ